MGATAMLVLSLAQLGVELVKNASAEGRDVTQDELDQAMNLRSQTDVNLALETLRRKNAGS